MRHGEKDYVDLAADMLRRVREVYLRYSQTRMGEELGAFLGRPPVRPGQIGRWERGDQKMPAYYLLALKDMTRRSLDSLFDEVDGDSLRAQIAELQRRLDEREGRHNHPRR